MSVLYHTTGIVLSKRDWREADRVYSVLTPNHGKIELVGRGARKPLAKLAAHLEFCAEVDLLVVRGRIYETVAGVERQRVFNFHQDFNKFLLANHSLQLIDWGTREKEADQILYKELRAFLTFLHSAPELSSERSAFLLSSFALKILAILGYRPELGVCLQCLDIIRPGDFFWHAIKGGVVCRGCATNDPEQWFSAKPLSDEVLKLLRFALSEKFFELLKPRLNGSTVDFFYETVESLLIAHFPTIPAVSLRRALIF